MKKNKYLLFLIAFLFLTSFPSIAQIVGPDAFIQGNFVEIGVGPGGYYGTTGNAPAGYHPRTPGPTLGFVADPDKDGWTAGIPNYCGDYFVPGFPQEGWDIQVGSSWAKAWLSGMTGGISGANVSYTATATDIKAVWEGTYAGLALRQTTILKKNKVYFLIKITMKNTTSAPIKNIYYDRTLDPDNASTMTGLPGVVTSPGPTTKNTIEFKLPNAKSKSLVSAIADLTVQKDLGGGLLDTVDYPVYLGIGSKDCRAKPYILSSGLTPSTTDSPSRLYNNDNSMTHLFDSGETNTTDAATGLIFNITNLNPGDSTSFFMAYVLSTADLDSAFADMAPVWEYDGKKYESGDTVKMCRNKAAPDEKKVLNIFGGDDYTWNWASKPGLKNLSGTLNEITLNNTPVTYIARPTESFGCLDSMRITIMPYVDPDPPTTVTPIYYCQYDAAVPLTATTSSAGVFRWYTTPTGGTPAATVTPNVLAAGSQIFYVSVANGICESSRTPLQVITRAIPKMDNFTFTPPTYCGAKNGTITFTTDSANTTYTLTYDRNGVPATPITITTDVAKSYTMTGLYGGVYSSFIITNKYGCKSSPYYGPVELLDPRPPGPPITNNGPLCVGATATFTVPFIAGAIYKWTGPAGFTSSVRNPSFIATKDSKGVYVLLVTVDSCTYLPSIDTLVITPTPQHQEFTPPYQLCENTDLVVEVLREPAVNYLWTGKGVTQLDQDLKLPSIQLAQSGQYILTSTSDNGCVTMDTITVAVDKRATFSMVSDTAICSVDSALLPVNSDAVKIRWTPTNGLSDSTSFNVKARPAATTTYTAVASPGNTCPDTSGSATVTIIPTPSVIGYDTLVRMNIPYVIMPTFGQEVVKWTWVPGDSLSCSDCPKPTFNSNKPMSYLVYGTNAEGCVGKDTVNIRVFCDGANVTMPNAFTPNNDGNNDIYYVRGTGFTVKSFTIFNRLGQEVFRKENFTPNDPSMGWDGTFGGQVISDAAGFVYMLEVVCFNSGYEPMIMKGTVLMIK